MGPFLARSRRVRTMRCFCGLAALAAGLERAQKAAPDSRVWRAARKQDERARWSAVVPLALEKRLFLNVRWECLLVPPFGKKPCNINKRLETF
jgi:hypothetical protein